MELQARPKNQRLWHGPHRDSGYGASVGIANYGGDYRPQYQFRRVVVRENIVRLFQGVANANFLGIQLWSNENLLAQRNILDLLNPYPIQGVINKAAAYFNNQSPTGALIRGVDSQTETNQTKYDELATFVEDAFSLSI